MLSYEEIQNLLLIVSDKETNWYKIPDVQRAFKLISTSINIPSFEPGLIKYINSSHKNKEGKIMMYMPKYRMEVYSDCNNLEGMTKTLKKYGLIELVNKYLPQKTAMRAMPTNPKKLNDMLELFLHASKIKSEITMTETDDVYEFILQDNMVNNSEERMKFVDEFKLFLVKLNLNELADSVVSELHDISEYPNHEEWSSISHTPQYDMGGTFSISKVKDNIPNSITIIINNNNCNIGSDGTINNITYTKEDFAKTEDGFINYIKNTKPDWYPVEGGWVDIDILYSNYKDFGLNKVKNHFANKLKNILWTDKINRTKYYCKKL